MVEMAFSEFMNFKDLERILEIENEMFSDLKISNIVQIKNRSCADDEEIEIFRKIKKAAIAEKEINLDDKFKDKSTCSSECPNPTCRS